MKLLRLRDTSGPVPGSHRHAPVVAPCAAPAFQLHSALHGVFPSHHFQFIHTGEPAFLHVGLSSSPGGVIFCIPSEVYFLPFGPPFAVARG